MLQKRTHAAGAQRCLARLLRAPAWASLPRCLVCHDRGWLASAAEEAGAQVLVAPFPSTRSLRGRWFDNALWARRVARQRVCWPQSVASEDAPVTGMVLANDLHEAPLALRLARRLRWTAASFLRSSDMSASDFLRYGGDRLDRVFSVNEQLDAVARGALVGAVGRGPRFRVLPDGLEDADFLPPKPWPSRFPKRVLVVGSEHPDKGWCDFVAAWQRLEPELTAAIERLDFLAAQSPPPCLASLGGVLGEVWARREDFQSLVRSYDLVIAPSRRESFGMAVLECLAAGVPVLCSRTGVAEAAIAQPAWLFEPGSVSDLSLRLSALIEHWTDWDEGFLANIGVKLRSEFLIDGSARRLAADLGGEL